MAAMAQRAAPPPRRMRASDAVARARRAAKTRVVDSASRRVRITLFGGIVREFIVVEGAAARYSLDAGVVSFANARPSPDPPPSPTPPRGNHRNPPLSFRRP